MRQRLDDHYRMYVDVASKIRSIEATLCVLQSGSLLERALGGRKTRKRARAEREEREEHAEEAGVLHALSRLPTDIIELVVKEACRTVTLSDHEEIARKSSDTASTSAAPATEIPTSTLQGLLDTAGIDHIDLGGMLCRGDKLVLHRPGVTLSNGTLVLYGGPTQHRWADGSVNEVPTVGVAVCAPGVVLRRIKITGTNYWARALRHYDTSDSTRGAAVLVHGGARGVLLEDCVLENNTHVGIHVVGPRTEVHLARCTVSNQADDGMVADEGAEVYCAGCTVTRCRGYGVLARLGATAQLTAVALLRNAGRALGAAMGGRVLCETPCLAAGNTRGDGNEIGGIVALPYEDSLFFRSLSDAFLSLEAERGAAAVRRIKRLTRKREPREDVTPAGSPIPVAPLRAPATQRTPDGAAGGSGRVGRGEEGEDAPGDDGSWMRRCVEWDGYPAAVRALLRGVEDDGERPVALLQSMVHSAFRVKEVRRTMSPEMMGRAELEKEGVALWQT